MAFSKLYPSFKEWSGKTRDFSKLIREDSETKFKIDKDELEESCGDSLTGSAFPNDRDAYFKWRVNFFPLGHNIDIPPGYCSIVLISDLKIIERSVSFFARFEIVNENKVLIAGEEIEVHALKNHDLCGYVKFALNTLKSSEGNSLIVHVQVCAFYEMYSFAASKFASKWKLLDDYSDLLEHGTFSDIVIRSNETKFKVHRAILASRSEVFAAMLSTEMSENLTGEIMIEDISEITVDKMLKFIYGCKVEFKDLELTLDLLEASDKYNLTDLKAQCEEYLSTIINKANAVTILLRADLHNLTDLKKHIFKYIYEHSEEFSSGEQYQILASENPMLLVEVTKALSICIDIQKPKRFTLF